VVVSGAGDARSSGRRLRAQAVHRVGPDDVGERVSIRHQVTTPEGPRPTDVVARLLGYEAGMLVLIDRAAQLVVVPESAVIASRVVPPHPRRPAEPSDLGTEDRPLPREAARVLLLDDRDRVLLVAHRPAPDRAVWTAPGGGLEPGEEHAQAARRELDEELGLTVDVGPWVFVRRVTFVFAGVWLDQSERWFLSRTVGYDAATAPLVDAGNLGARWWSLDDLRTTDETVAPAALAEHLARLLTDGPPRTPVDVGR
jgi:8-oxo-dGTP pyrophosphatase MutT (NUDIX family)